MENPSLAPSTKDSYTGTFLKWAYNGIKAIMTGTAHADNKLIHPSKETHLFSVKVEGGAAIGGFLRKSR
ncbi:hypothetical protein D3C81_1768030 [compost metagenome]